MLIKTKLKKYKWATVWLEKTFEREKWQDLVIILPRRRKEEKHVDSKMPLSASKELTLTCITIYDYYLLKGLSSPLDDTLAAGMRLDT